MHAQTASEGLLATAIMDLVNTQGKHKTCRVFLDAGSQANIITDRTASFSKLPRKRVDISVSGVDNISTEIKHSVSATLKSRFSQYSQNLDLCDVVTHSVPLNAKLAKFWEVEEIPSTKVLSQEEQACEAHFKENTQRNFEGRYIVRLPFNENKEKLGESRHMALRRFKLLKKRFERNPELKSKYCEFLSEYKNLNHLSLIKNETLTMPGFYLPHHAVMKEDSMTTKLRIVFDSMTTKLRIVFDSSAKTSTGVSLNDTLMVGPTI